MQTEMRCCGGLGYGDGYKVWEDKDVGKIHNGVPDSCCVPEEDEVEVDENCGHHMFWKRLEKIVDKIYIHGCITVLQQILRTAEKYILFALWCCTVCGIVAIFFSLIALLSLCADGLCGSREKNYKECEVGERNCQDSETDI